MMCTDFEINSVTISCPVSELQTLVGVQCMCVLYECIHVIKLQELTLVQQGIR